VATPSDSADLRALADRRSRAYQRSCFFDLSGDQGLLGQVEGRTADDAAYWLAQAPPAWRDAVQVVAIDMCSIYASAVRRALPHAQLVVDLFHVAQLAVKMTGDVRRRAVREKYGRRGRSGDAEYKGLLVRNLERLRPEQFATVLDTLSADRHGQEIAAAWIGKEKLRDALNLRARITGSAPCERDVRGRLACSYDWCAQNDDVPELLTLARTISKWEDQIVAAILTGVTNARSEALNRLAKLEARMACSFRNPANQRRRVQIACTRTVTPIRAGTPRRSRQLP
jgi:transposase